MMEGASQVERSRWRSLSAVMGARMLLIALIPLVVLAATVTISWSRSVTDLQEAILSTREEMAHDVVGEELQYTAADLMKAIDNYMNERIHDANEWANSPIVRQAALDGAARAADLGLTALTVDEIETRMEETRVLIQDPELTAYLTGLVQRTPAFAEVFFTDENGFNVAFSNMTSDFVQIGEEWWDTAWAEGSHVGSVEYDASAGVFSVEISVRIMGADGKALGVLKAVLDVGALQALALEAAAQIDGGTVRLFTEEGAQIADTASGNDPALIMTDEGNLLEMGWEPVQDVISRRGGESGYLLGQQNLDGDPVVVGYATSAPGSYFDVPGFDGFDWKLTVAQSEEVAFAPLSGLDSVAANMGGSRSSTVTIVLVICAVTAIGAVVAAVLTSRGIVRPLARLAEASRRISAGDMVVLLAEQHNEIGDLERAFSQMTVQLDELLRSEQEQREYLQATVRTYVEHMAEIGRGNLAARVTIEDDGREDDPLATLGHNLNDTTASLQAMTIQIREAANNLSAAAAEILTSTTQQAAGASEQSAAISQASTTIDEVRAISEQTSQRAQGVADASQRTTAVSVSGQQALAETIGGVAQVKEKVESIASGILDLSEKTQAIGEIIATVNEIASQSNMLALNAAVEAARAGEAGKGFAVVAGEVRSLAEQSQTATEQVRDILSEIQRGVNSAVMATEEGMKMADAGVRLAGEAGRAIRELGESVAESAQSGVQIAAAAGQQLTGMEQIATAMANIDQSTVQSLASTQQAEKTAQNLAELAGRLNETVGQYRL